MYKSFITPAPDKTPWTTLRQSVSSWCILIPKDRSEFEKLWVTFQSVIYLDWRGVDLRSNPLQLQSKSNAPYLNRNNSYLYRLARNFGSNWRECSRPEISSLSLGNATKPITNKFLKLRVSSLARTVIVILIPNAYWNNIGWESIAVLS